MLDHGVTQCFILYSMSMTFSNCNDELLSSGEAEDDGGLTPT